ncbi:CBS domain-containing protein [[Eubacterium] cellulosolvens]
MAKEENKSVKRSVAALSEEALTNASDFFESEIKDAMDKRSWDVPIIEMDSEIIDVFAILCTNDHVWVVENRKNRNVIGVITEHDILNALRPIKRHSFFGVPSRKGMGLSLFETAEQIMSHDPFLVTPDMKVKDVLHDMEAHGVRRMPVVKPKSSEIIGEVTVHQLIRKYYNVVKPLCMVCDQCSE